MTAATAEARPTLAPRFKPGDVALCTCSSAIKAGEPFLWGDKWVTRPRWWPGTEEEYSSVHANRLYLVDLPQPVIPEGAETSVGMPSICLSGVSGYYFEWRFSRVDTRTIRGPITAELVTMANAIQAVRRKGACALWPIQTLEAEGFGPAEIIEYGEAAYALATQVWG